MVVNGGSTVIPEMDFGTYYFSSITWYFIIIMLQVFIKIATAYLGGWMDWQIQKNMQRDQGVHVG